MLHFLPLVRKDRNLSRDQLARAVGTHRDRIARLERGERPRDVGTIQRLADALGVSADVLTAGSITISRQGEIRVTR
jgi:transcriptional regulator with XRE-family HTH domain